MNGQVENMSYGVWLTLACEIYINASEGRITEFEFRTRGLAPKGFFHHGKCPDLSLPIFR